MMFLIACASLTVAFAQSNVQVQSWGANSMRIRISKPGNPIVDPLINGLLDYPPAGFDTVVNFTLGSAQVFTNGNIQVSSDASGSLTISRIDDGRIILAQRSLQWGPAPVGTKVGSASANISFAGVSTGEQIVGFGEQQDGQVIKSLPFNRSIEASEYYPYNHGSQALVPFYLSTAGYAILFNSPSYGVLYVGTDQLYYFSNATLCLDMWVSTVPAGYTRGSGLAFPPLLSQYADAAGHAPPIPYFATGFLASKDRYRNQSQLLNVARGYVKRGLPLSLITIDWLHWANLGDMMLRPECWPEPQAMVNELASMGVELMVTFWPFMNSSSINYPSFSSSGYLAVNRSSGNPDTFWYCPSCNDNGGALIDATSAATRQAAFDRFWANIGSLGVRAVWLDETEPDRDGYTYGQWQLAAGADYEIGAAWKKEWIRTLADGYASKGVMPGDFFLLSRSFWLGTQQFGNTVWSGDLASTWDEFKLQVQAGQGAGLSGQGMWTTDIAGYFNGDPTQPSFQELAVRWFQFAALTPVMRLHGHRTPPNGQEPPGAEAACWQTHGDNEPWTLVPEGSDFYNAIVAAMRLRENLREYVAATNSEYASTGMPMMRPMMLVCADEPCQDGSTEGQFMLGADWLIAPILDPISAKTSRSVYLPSLPNGQVWLHWWSQLAQPAGGWITWTFNGTYVDFPLYKRVISS